VLKRAFFNEKRHCSLVQNFSSITRLIYTVPLHLLRPPQRATVWIALPLLLIAISTVTRTALLINSWSLIDPDPAKVVGIYALGFLFDLANAMYVGIPLVLYLWLVPDKNFYKTWHRFIILATFFIFTFTLTFTAFAEWFFWEEFGARFNFIAVDYLVYTREVIGNITQSYPVIWIVFFVAVISASLTMAIGFLLRQSQPTWLSFKRRSAWMAFYVLLFATSHLLVSSRLQHFSRNAFANELAGNGLYDLFAAYFNNELSYDRFYKAIDRKLAFNMVEQMIATPETRPVSKTVPVERNVINHGVEKKLNVILISVESFSADFMRLFGITNNITPFLDSLSQRSMTFTNLFATGTRTVRGLEALSLCVPPTPGQSIVRRPDNQQLFSLATVFEEKGYHCQYIYGGYGYFDNMNAFFEHNDYEVIDRTALNDRDIHYENIWGVADEDLYTLALREIDKHVAVGPVFTQIMTTSNHRPFTYPSGRIDIPSHTGRNGAVKYTDYAIGQFIKKASRKSWFPNTIFVIVADHCAASAGKTELPVNKYHIPMLIYSPGNIRPMRMDRLMSQIDIGPTLLGLLNFSYKSKFYGYDIFQLEPGKERAFISTYQSLGYMKANKLVILSPPFKVQSVNLSKDLQPDGEATDGHLINEAIAWYQTASFAFGNGLMKK
jgi:phosphoglycerol transferase MdoB-like AlkP superfamily enzyme